MNKTTARLGWLLASPYLIYSFIFFLFPLIWALYLAFTNWNLIAPDYETVGLQNFIEAFFSQSVRAAFWTTYKFMLMFVPIVVAGALFLALIIYSLPRLKGLFSVGYFLPYLASGVASAIVVKGVLSYNSPLNIFFRNHLGMDINWLDSPILAPLMIALMMAWKFVGYYALLFLSGLESIPKEIYEAAEMDGAVGWKRFWYVTIPMLYPSFYTVTILAVGLMFGIFTEPYVLTGGGPDYSTHTWQLEIYNQAFEKLNAGYGTAVAIINSIVTFASILVFRKILEKWGAKHGWE
ncbi:binding--dependent transport system inner membrane component family protein [Anoxybacillus sp. B7M1]|uniref:carbohydrate ABC transporter permease n=1 Tax=unclassified Anoxybacillus TaxID=2639704 RepID=UPI0005CD71F3|nr:MULTISPECIES: sugar ABC transporter permease [unclassified Anoxybacillus]ANB55649.1 binding--dependent transport system inner membrane component family protein [Anoxybacillus sp. B2M1]ANB62555.1 binding--dependent transport system inner membrane component family protein [Anoxybacillus sp. B7M1]